MAEHFKQEQKVDNSVTAGLDNMKIIGGGTWQLNGKGKVVRNKTPSASAEPTHFPRIELEGIGGSRLNQEYLTDEGLVITSIQRSTRNLVQQLAENRGHGADARTRRSRWLAEIGMATGRMVVMYVSCSSKSIRRGT
ncbi:hypothetical protein pipiens_018886 [Culex pipiens pipiens]|uniref:Uncharacterized protein n=1 Tax=Culex pipiens pipiens TaxID=38569 RepID=A0ABD1DXN5_CULPP